MLLDILAVLLTIIIRSESYEHYLAKILERASEKTGITIDMPQILSIEYRVLRKNMHNPDTRAIRDAVSHQYFKIEKNISNDYLSNFDNTDKGWQFQKEVARKSLLIFYQNLDRLFDLYARLLTLKLFNAFLAINFLA